MMPFTVMHATPRRLLPAPARLLGAVGALGVACLAGCASSLPFMKALQPEEAARERERYGPTADQRMDELGAAARAARGASAARQAEFTDGLVRQMLAEHDPRVRCRILAAAAEFDTPSADSICTGALADPDQRVRMEACSAWSQRGGPRAIELLAERARADAELDVRLRALRALGDLRDEEAIPVLAKALEDPDPAVQYRAVAALRKVSGRDLGNDVNRWREWAADPQGSSAEWSMAEAFRRLF